MPRNARVLLAGACLLAALLGGCRGMGGDGQRSAAQEQEWRLLEETKKQVDGQRQELAALREQLDAAPVDDAEVAAGEAPAAGSRADLASRVARLEEEVRRGSEELGNRLVSYIESFGPAEGEPPAPAQQQAIRMKSDEDIEVAQEWIDRGGDYRRAIEIYETQQREDPGYERLEQALASARAMRYVTAERFEQVEDGMTQAQVRKILGPVNLHLVRAYPDQQVEAWYYPREGGGTSGVYFRLDEPTRVFAVYKATFEVDEIESAQAATAGDGG